MQDRRHQVAGVLAIIVMALLGGGLLILTPFLLLTALHAGDHGGSFAADLLRRLLLPWAIFGACCVAIAFLLRRRPVWSLLLALCLFGALGWAKGQLQAAELAIHQR